MAPAPGTSGAPGKSRRHRHRRRRRIGRQSRHRAGHGAQAPPTQPSVSTGAPRRPVARGFNVTGSPRRHFRGCGPAPTHDDGAELATARPARGGSAEAARGIASRLQGSERGLPLGSKDFYCLQPAPVLHGFAAAISLLESRLRRGTSVSPDPCPQVPRGLGPLDSSGRFRLARPCRFLRHLARVRAPPRSPRPTHDAPLQPAPALRPHPGRLRSSTSAVSSDLRFDPGASARRLSEPRRAASSSSAARRILVRTPAQARATASTQGSPASTSSLGDIFEH